MIISILDLVAYKTIFLISGGLLVIASFFLFSRDPPQEPRGIKLSPIRLILFIYFSIVVLVSIVLVVYAWTPEDISVRIDTDTNPLPEDRINATGATVPVTNITTGSRTDSGETLNAGPNVTTRVTTIENATIETVKTENFLSFENGTIRFLNTSQNTLPKETGLIPFLRLQSADPEVRLVSVSVLFGLLGAGISGITTLLRRRAWDVESTINRRLIYDCIARPWFGVAVAVVTYVTLRAGLINIGGDLDEVKAISGYGIAAISALVGFMADEMITRLRDIFRTLFGFPSLQAEQELRLSLAKYRIYVGDTIQVTALLPELRSATDVLTAYFSVGDPTKVRLVDAKSEFNDAGVAVSGLEGMSAGDTFVIAMVQGDPNLHASRSIKVEVRPQG